MTARPAPDLLVDALVGDYLRRPRTPRKYRERSTTRVSALSRLRGRTPTPTEPSLDDRLAESMTRTAFALNAFTDAADELSEAASLAENVCALAQFEIDRLEELQDAAFAEADAARNAARRIRDLFAA